MKIVKFYTPETGPRTGALADGLVVELESLVRTDGADLRRRPARVTIGDVLALPEADRLLLGQRVQDEAGRGSALARPLGGVELLPVDAENKVLCQVVNYRAHGQEANIRPPAKPFFFYKPYSSLATDGAPLYEIGASAKLDFECELALVIGRPATASANYATASCSSRTRSSGGKRMSRPTITDASPA